MLASGRLYSCVRCRVLVFICRPCDRGNIYCFGSCAQTQRAESKRRASRNYQKTRVGKLKHAAAEARRRERRKKNVTDHGSQTTEDCVSLDSGATAEPKVQQPVEPAIEIPAIETADSIGLLIVAIDYRCHGCGTLCSELVRFEPWHGGRLFKKRGVNRDSPKRDRVRHS